MFGFNLKYSHIVVKNTGPLIGIAFNRYFIWECLTYSNMLNYSTQENLYLQIRLLSLLDFY